jgi:hypothetical protein
VIKVHTAEQQGPIERSYELQTNDPRHPVIKVTLAATVKALPGYVKRITTADVGRGEVIGAFQVWPTARPSITVEAGERLTIALRIRSIATGAPDASTLKLAPDAPDTWKLRREPKGGDYWLDIPTEASSGSGTRAATLVVDPGDGRTREMRVRVTVNVLAENLVVTPKAIDFGEISLAKARTSLQRVGIRKLVGTFHIKALSSSLPFLKLEQTTMVENTNYLVRVTIDPANPLKPGTYDGVLLIETDGGNRIEVSIKVKLVAQ